MRSEARPAQGLNAHTDTVWEINTSYRYHYLRMSWDRQTSGVHTPTEIGVQLLNLAKNLFEKSTSLLLCWTSDLAAMLCTTDLCVVTARCHGALSQRVFGMRCHRSSSQIDFTGSINNWINSVYRMSHLLATVSRVCANASAWCFHICLSCVIFCNMYPSSSRLVRLSTVSSVFL